MLTSEIYRFDKKRQNLRDAGRQQALTMKILVCVSIFLLVERVAVLPFPLICVSDCDFKAMALKEAGVCVRMCARTCARETA